MPVAQSRGHAGKALIVASVSVVLLLGLALAVAVLASRGDVEIRLGDSRFDAGRAEEIAASIDKEGGLPLLYPDLVGRGRNLYLQHLGTDPQRGWVAFGAFDPDDPSCGVELDRDERVLVNVCDREITYPLDGTGLRAYPVSVEGNRVHVDINELSTTTTTVG